LGKELEYICTEIWQVCYRYIKNTIVDILLVPLLLAARTGVSQAVKSLIITSLKANNVKTKYVDYFCTLIHTFMILEPRYNEVSYR
jgi:hypothetical protein